MMRKWIGILVSVLAVLVLTGCYPVVITPDTASSAMPTIDETTSVPGASISTPVVMPGSATTPLTSVPTSQATPAAQKQIIITGTPTSPSTNPATLAIVNLAKQSLSRRTGIPVAQIELVDVQSATWTDQSLGCPEPGPARAQVQVKGVKIRLSAGGRVYEYHFGPSVGPVLCPLAGPQTK